MAAGGRRAGDPDTRDDVPKVTGRLAGMTTEATEPGGEGHAGTFAACLLFVALIGTNLTVAAEDPEQAAGIVAGATRVHPLTAGLSLRVEVPTEEPAEAGTVELVIFEEAPDGLILSRLTTRRTGQLSNSWRTDLDDDDQPEFVLAFTPPGSQGDGPPPQTLQVWEWQADLHAFVPMTLPPLETPALIVERQLAVAEDALEWRVVLRSADGERSKAVYRFDATDGRWNRRRNWLPW
jgi:hypothetical protein